MSEPQKNHTFRQQAGNLSASFTQHREINYSPSGSQMISFLSRKGAFNNFSYVTTYSILLFPTSFCILSLYKRTFRFARD